MSMGQANRWSVTALPSAHAPVVPLRGCDCRCSPVIPVSGVAEVALAAAAVVGVWNSKEMEVWALMQKQRAELAVARAKLVFGMAAQEVAPLDDPCC